VPVEKLSISVEAELAAAVRKAAAEEGVSVSTWLGDAAQAKARRRALRHALDELARERGELSDTDIDAIIGSARARSRVTRGKRRAS
jgi:hypothetical protein